MDKHKYEFITNLTPICVVYKHLEGQGKRREMFVHTHPFLLPINLKSYTTATKKSY